MQFERGDFMAEGDSMTYIPLLPFGLRGIDNRDFDTLLGRMFLDGHSDSDAPAGFAAIGTPVDGNPQPLSARLPGRLRRSRAVVRP